MALALDAPQQFVRVRSEHLSFALDAVEQRIHTLPRRTRPPGRSALDQARSLPWPPARREVQVALVWSPVARSQVVALAPAPLPAVRRLATTLFPARRSEADRNGAAASATSVGSAA
jgi:hypothetical protein